MPAQSGRMEKFMQDVKSAALRLALGKRRTERELAEALFNRGYDMEEAEEAAAYYRRAGYINHAEYARRFAHDAATIKGHGPQRIARELSSRGVEAEYIEAALSEIEFDILTPMEARFGKGPRPVKEINRIYQYFNRRGFASSVIRTAMDALYTYE